jgi:dihydroorotase
MSINPRKRFGIPFDGSFTVWELDREYTVNPDEFLSKGRATPFTGERLSGVCMLTVCDNKAVYEHQDI